MKHILSIRAFFIPALSAAHSIAVLLLTYIFGEIGRAERFKHFVFFLSSFLLINSAFSQRHYFDRDDRVEDMSELKRGETMEGKTKNNFFLKTEVSKTECFVGETIMATFKAYTRLNANSQVVQRPSLTGFSVMEMVDGYSNNPDVEMVNGKSFYVHLIRKVQLIPLQPGAFKLEGAEVESIIHFTRSDDRRSPIISLRDFLRGSSKRAEEAYEDLDYHITLETPVVNVTVKPLPVLDQPSDFSGAVGEFSVSAYLDDKKIALYDPAIVRFVIKGMGNLPLITEPSVSWPAGLSVSAPVVTEEVNKYIYPLSGSKTFQYTLETPSVGNHIVPPLRFSYFNPSDKKYKIIQTSALDYTVTPAKNKGPGSEDNRSSLKYKSGLPLHWYWFGGIALIILICIAYQLFKLRQSSKRRSSPQTASDPEKPALQYEATEKSMGMVRSARNDADKKTFYSKVQQTIREAISERYKVQSNILTRNQLLQILREDQKPEALVQEISALMNKCEWALYTPEYNQDDMDETYEALQSILPDIKS